MKNGMPTLENNLSVSYKVQHTVTITAIPLLDIYYLPRRNKYRYSHENLYMKVSSGSTHNCPKLETTQVSLSWGMDKKTVVYTMEYALEITRNGILIHATPWMNINVILAERSQT